MNYEDIINGMSEEEIQFLMETEFGPELEKQAAAELAQSDLADALYTYGALMCDMEINSTEGLSKQASAEYADLSAEIAAALEDALLTSGILESEDTAELHKEAQAAAGLIFQGYADQFEKIAKLEVGKYGQQRNILSAAEAHAAQGNHVRAKYHQVKDWITETAKKHPKKLSALGGAAVGAGTIAAIHKYKKQHEKKASETTASELADIVREEAYLDSVIFEGMDKLANEGAKAAEQKEGIMHSLREKATAAKNYIEGKGKDVWEYAKKKPYHVGGGAAAAAGLGYLGHKMYKKHKEGK